MICPQGLTSRCQTQRVIHLLIVIPRAGTSYLPCHLILTHWDTIALSCCTFGSSHQKWCCFAWNNIIRKLRKEQRKLMTILICYSFVPRSGWQHKIFYSFIPKGSLFRGILFYVCLAARFYIYLSVCLSARYNCLISIFFVSTSFRWYHQHSTVCDLQPVNSNYATGTGSNIYLFSSKW